MLKRVVVVLGVVVLAWWVFASLNHQPQTSISEKQAVDFALADARQLDADKRVLSVEKQGDEWDVEVLLSFNSHSACPLLVKRSYRLLPIRFREEAIVKDCSPKNLLAYPEEALITSASLMPIAKTPGSYGCAFYLSGGSQPACDKVDSAALSEFSKGLPADAWVVYWTAGGENSFLAFDRYANVLKRS